MLKRFLATLALSAAALSSHAVASAPIDGLWHSPPRDSGAWITVRVGPCDDAPEQRCGTVESVHGGANPEVVGERVLRGLERQPDGRWAEGRVTRPIEGTVYRTRLRLASADVVVIEGCTLLGLICKEQTWTRIE